MLALLLVFAIASNPFEVSETVDLTELNHFHDENGCHVYSQLIFYDWDEAKGRHVVRAWRLVDRPIKLQSNRFAWYDRDEFRNREIVAKYTKESWSQVDPERANKKILDEKLRTGLIKTGNKDTEPSLELMTDAS
jgi:hypothetical protein